MTALTIANNNKAGDSTAIAKMLIKNGADLERTNRLTHCWYHRNGFNALMGYALYGNLEIIEMLINAGVEIDKKNK